MKLIYLLTSILMIYSCRQNTNKSGFQSNTMEVTIQPNDTSAVVIVLGDEIIANEEARALNYAGIELAKEGKYRKAEKKFIAAFRIEADNPIILNNLGNIYKEIGTIKMALEYYNESFVASDSTYFSAGYNLGIIYSKLGEYDKSLNILNKLIKNTDDQNRIMITEYAKVSVFIGKKNCDKAKQLYGRIKIDLDAIPELINNRKIVEKRIKNCVQQ